MDGKRGFLYILSVVTRNVVITNIPKRIYGAGFPAIAIMPDHIEWILQKINRLSINKTFIIKKRKDLHCFFIGNLLVLMQ